MNRRDAQQNADALYRQLQKDPIVFARHFVNGQNKKHALPFDKVARTYFEEHVEVYCRPSTRRTHEQMLRVHLVPAFACKDLRDIGVSEIHTYMAKKLRSNLSRKTVTNHLSVLSSLFQFAIVREWITDNPCRKVRPPKVAEQGFEWLNEAEGREFLAAVKRRDPGYYDLFLTAMRTGMRQGELFALQWGDVRFQNNIISVRASMFGEERGATKGMRSRQLHMDPEVRAALLPRRGRSGDLVFSRPDGRPLTGNIVKNPLRRAKMAIDRPRLTFHGLRHSFASQLAAGGANLQAIQKLLGHRDIQTTLQYAHLAPGELRRAMAVLGPVGLDAVGAGDGAGSAVADSVASAEEVPLKASA